MGKSTGARLGIGCAFGLPVAAFAIAFGAPTTAEAAPATPSHPVPTIGQYDHVMAPAITGTAKAQADAKHAKAVAYVESIARTAKATSGTVQPAITASTLGVTYQVQTQPSWCGPTTLAIILGYKGWGWSGTQATQQQNAANLLGVSATGPGTPWQGSDNVPTGGPWVSSYPIQDALNYKEYQHVKGTWWAPVALPGSPTSSQKTAYKTDLLYDIDAGFPFANNEYAAPGYSIGKQPTNEWIMHWFASNGYANSGSTTYFADPGWGGGSRSSATTNDVVVALGGRGYIW